MTAPLALVWHITKKDLRALRWLIALWATLTVLEAVFRGSWPPIMLAVYPQSAQWVDSARWLESTRLILPFTRALFFMEIVVLLVHADPLVTTDAFWLTRPIAPRVLFFSKLLTAALVLIVPTCLTQVVLMLALGVPLLEVVSVIPEILLYTTTGLAVLLIGAALTANQRDLLAWGLGLFAVTLVAITIVFNLESDRRSAKLSLTTRALTSAGLSRLDPQIAAEVLFSTGFIGAAAHLYWTRRRGRSGLIAAASAGAGLFIMAQLLPYEMFTERRLTPLASAIPLGASMHYNDGPRALSAYPIGEDGDGNCRAMVRVTRVQGRRTVGDSPWLIYGFVHRPTGHALFAGPQSFVRDTEAFQIQHQYVLIGPPKRGNDRREPEPRITSVSCRDVDVWVTRQIFAPKQ